MKKIISILLVFCMLFGFSAVAFANDGEEEISETERIHLAFIEEKMAEGMTYREAEDEYLIYFVLIPKCGNTEAEARQWVYNENRINITKAKV